MKNLKKDLQTVDKDLKALSKKVEKMIVAGCTANRSRKKNTSVRCRKLPPCHRQV